MTLFVPYNIAQKAKQKGFDEPCLAYYTHDGKLCKYGITDNAEHVDILTCTHKDLYYTYLLAPLYQQIIDWLRTTHNIHITISPNLAFNTELGQELPKDLTYRVYLDNRYYLHYTNDGKLIPCLDYIAWHKFNSYQEAQDAAILYCFNKITNIIL